MKRERKGETDKQTDRQTEKRKKIDQLISGQRERTRVREK